MQSPYKRVIVYDLETGGLNYKWNSITEIAMVVIDLQNLDIIEEHSIMFKPRLNLSNAATNDALKEAKALFNSLKIKDEETGLNILHYKGHEITLKNLEPLVKDLEIFYKEFLQDHGDVIEFETILKLEQNPKFVDIVKLFFDKCYNPQALEVTHIDREMLVAEGIDFQEGFVKIKNIISSHTVGNSKPIIAGHNIGSLPRR